MSAVGICVCVPTIADTRPFRCHPMAIFSLVSSAWKSTKRTFTAGSIAAKIWSALRKGQSVEGMCARPCRLNYCYLHVVAALNYCPAPPRQVVNVISGSDESRLLVEVLPDFSLVPDVVAGGKNVQSQFKQLFRDQRRNPKAPAEFSALAIARSICSVERM